MPVVAMPPYPSTIPASAFSSTAIDDNVWMATPAAAARRASVSICVRGRAGSRVDHVMQDPVSALPPASAGTARRERTAAQSHKGAVAFRREGLLHADWPWLTINSPQDSQISASVHEHRTERSESERDAPCVEGAGDRSVSRATASRSFPVTVGCALAAAVSRLSESEVVRNQPLWNPTASVPPPRTSNVSRPEIMTTDRLAGSGMTCLLVLKHRGESDSQTLWLP
jgi:hypothetical protein